MKDRAGRVGALPDMTPLAGLSGLTTPTTIAMPFMPCHHRLRVGEYRRVRWVKMKSQRPKADKIIKRLSAMLIEVQREINSIILLAEVNPRIHMTKALERLISRKPGGQGIVPGVDRYLHLMDTNEPRPAVLYPQRQRLGIQSYQ